MGGEEPEGVVAPVVDQPALGERRLGDELVHRQQLDRRHAEVVEVVDDRRRRQPGVRAAQVLGDAVVQRGDALDVQLVDHGVAPAAAHRRVVAPQSKVGVDDDAARRGTARSPRSLRSSRVGPRRSRRSPGRTVRSPATARA